MNAQVPALRDHLTANAWRPATIGFALLYGLMLAFAVATMSFSAGDAARHYIAQLANRPPAPLPALPVVRLVEWPDIAMQRDPFQPMATSVTPASSEIESVGAADNASTSEPFQLVATYQDTGQPYVIGRATTGKLARFGVSDEVNGGAIERIDPGRVTFNSRGQRNVVKILRAGPGRVQ